MMFEPKDFEDQECGNCGTKPSVSLGDGWNQCQKCFDSTWCSQCHYSIKSDLVDGKHVCQTMDVIVKRREKCAVEMGLWLDPIAYVNKLRAEIN